MSYKTIKGFNPDPLEDFNALPKKDKVYVILDYASRAFVESEIRAMPKTTKLKELRIRQRDVTFAVTGLINRKIRRKQTGWNDIPRDHLSTESTIQDCLNAGLKR